MTVDIFLGIKPNNVAAGPMEGQDRWLWNTRETFVFSDDFTFWGTYQAFNVCVALICQLSVEAKLPPISELLQEPSIRERDCFTLVLRLQTPATFPSTLSNYEKRLVDRFVVTIFNLSSGLTDQWLSLQKPVDGIEISARRRQHGRHQTGMPGARGAFLNQFGRQRWRIDIPFD